MSGQGLTRADIVRIAIELIESEGLHSFSLQELANRLHIRAASLYNHIRNADELHMQIGYTRNTIKASDQCVNTGQRPFPKKHTKHKLSVKFLEESILQDL